MYDILEPEEAEQLSSSLLRSLAKLASGILQPNAALPAEDSSTTKLAVSPGTAEKSLKRLTSLETNRPTAGQVARYGAVGALGGALTGALGHTIERGVPYRGSTPKARLLNLAANAARGAVSGGAIPLVRGALDRSAEKRTLRKFMHEASPK